MLISDFLNKPGGRVLAVVGAPGSGKTTLLRHTARSLCDAAGQPVPILLYLRDHVGQITADEPSLGELVDQVQRKRFGLADPAGWLLRRLAEGGRLVMLDGLAEVADPAHRQAVADWVRLQVIRYPRNDFAVTSRPLGYRSNPIEGALPLLN
jgi:predicted NACHT family NTPase